jgi:hypothetical protein
MARYGGAYQDHSELARALRYSSLASSAEHRALCQAAEAVGFALHFLQRPQ